MKVSSRVEVESFETSASYKAAPMHTSLHLVGCKVVFNASGSKLREVVGHKVIKKRRTYVKLASH
jgi:mRNA-degrading endonuclease HigB of HigAB toxin-antitoxin module